MTGDTAFGVVPVYKVSHEVKTVVEVTVGYFLVTDHCVTLGAVPMDFEPVITGPIVVEVKDKGTDAKVLKPLPLGNGCVPLPN